MEGRGGVTSKNVIIEKWGGWLNRNHSDGNIEFNFENGNIDSKTGSNGGQTGS